MKENKSNTTKNYGNSIGTTIVNDGNFIETTTINGNFVETTIDYAMSIKIAKQGEELDLIAN